MSLLDAIHDNHLASVVDYLQQGGNPDQFLEMGSPMLHEAVRANQPAMIRLLLQSGAQLELADLHGNKPLHLAGLYGSHAAVKLLLQSGAQIDSTTPFRPWTALMVAINARHVELACWLMEMGADPHFVDQQEGWTPFLLACDHGLSDLALELLKRGASVHDQLKGGDAAGKTGIHLASYFGAVDVVHAMIERGVNPNQIPTGGGLSALHWSVYNQHHKLFHYLIRAGADPNVEAPGLYRARTPLHFAVSGQQMDMAATLLSHGADPMKRDIDGKSPLDIALDRMDANTNSSSAVLLVEMMA
ncbi:MAG: ankyrin repeat domain-containing protein [Bacteroidota bacterium]